MTLSRKTHDRIALVCTACAIWALLADSLVIAALFGVIAVTALLDKGRA